MQNQALQKYREQFVSQWRSDTNIARIKQNLAPNVDFKRFEAVVLRAVQEDPDLLAVDDKMSLFLACQRAAQDGLIPDKREGALVVFRSKKGDDWVSGVQWMPMIGGLRKRLASLGFDIRARVVYENDHWDYEEGDNEQITHKPAPLNQPRGEVIGAYAIAEDLATGKKYRRVFRKEDIERVREVAKTKNIWDKWYAEKAMVAVSKNLIKWLPLDEKRVDQDELYQFQEVIDRDNEDFAPSAPPPSSDQARRVQEAARKRAEQEEPPPAEATAEVEFDDEEEEEQPPLAEPPNPGF